MNLEKLIGLREKNLKMTQKELAERLNTSQDMISKIEKGLTTPGMEFLKKYSSLSGGSLIEFLEYLEISSNKIGKNEIKIDASELSVDLKKEYKYFEENLKKMICEIKTDYLREKVKKNCDILNLEIKKYIEKPKVVFLGLSDSGKSSAINYFLQEKIVKSDWTPMTSTLVIIKHVLDKPVGLDINDKVLIYSYKTNNRTKWSEEEAFTREILEKNFEDSTATRKFLKGNQNFKIEVGDYSLLNRCNRKEGTIIEDIAVAIAYVDSPILEVCDLIDTPGLTESIDTEIEIDQITFSDVEKENALIVQAISIGDLHVFFNQINRFNDGNIRRIIKNSIKNSLEQKREPHIFVLASQADIVNNCFDRNNIILNAEAEFSRDFQGNNDVENQKAVDLIKESFFCFSIMEKTLNEKFVNVFKKNLVDIIPTERYKNFIINKKILLKLIENTIEMEEKNFEDKEQLLNQIKIMKESKEIIFPKYDILFSDLENYLKSRKKSDIVDFQRRIDNTITIENLNKLIVDKGYTKQQVKEYLSGDIEQIYEREINLIIKNAREIFENKVKLLYNDLKEITNSGFKTSPLKIDIPFDFANFFATAIGSIGTLAGLGFWSAALGSLGEYILVAKGVSLLSALGISVGGTAAAISFISAIGGPLVIGALIAIIIGSILGLIFGSTWQKRVATETYNQIIKLKITEKFVEVLDKEYNDTIALIQPLSKSLKKEFEFEIENLEKKLKDFEEKTSSSIKDDIENLKENCKNFNKKQNQF